MALIRGVRHLRRPISRDGRTLPEIAGSAKVAGVNNADLIVATLRAAGIGHGFGIPSGNVLPLIEGDAQGRNRFRAHRP